MSAAEPAELRVRPPLTSACYSCHSAEPPDAEVALTDELIHAMSVEDLKLELRDRGLKIGGRKDELRVRLRADVLQHGASIKWFRCDGCTHW